MARAYGGVPVRADVTTGGDGKERWDEARWQGTPGERTVWVVRCQSRRPGYLYRLAIRGRGPIRHFLPYGATSGSYQLPVGRVPLDYPFAHQEGADLSGKRLDPGLHFTASVARIAAARGGGDADEAYLIRTHR